MRRTFDCVFDVDGWEVGLDSGGRDTPCPLLHLRRIATDRSVVSPPPCRPSFYCRSSVFLGAASGAAGGERLRPCASIVCLYAALSLVSLTRCARCAAPMSRRRPRRGGCTHALSSRAVPSRLMGVLLLQITARRLRPLTSACLHALCDEAAAFCLPAEEEAGFSRPLSSRAPGGVRIACYLKRCRACTPPKSCVWANAARPFKLSFPNPPTLPAFLRGEKKYELGSLLVTSEKVFGIAERLL